MDRKTLLCNTRTFLKCFLKKKKRSHKLSMFLVENHMSKRGKRRHLKPPLILIFIGEISVTSC